MPMQLTDLSTREVIVIKTALHSRVDQMKSANQSCFKKGTRIPLEPDELVADYGAIAKMFAELADEAQELVNKLERDPHYLFTIRKEVDK